MVKPFSVFFITLVVLGFYVAKPARASLINGGFEQPALGGPGSYATFTPGGSGFAGWTVEAGSVDVVYTGFLGLPSAEGNQWLDLDGSTAGTISQVMQSNANSVYQLAFDYSGYRDGDGIHTSAGQSIIYQVFDGLSGNTIYQGSVLITPADLDVWNTIDIQVTSTSSLLGIRFASDGNTDDTFVGPTLDGVSLEAAPSVVPEPNSACLALIAGIVGFGYRLRGWGSARRR